MSNIFSDKHSAFRKGHSASTCLIEFLDVIYSNMKMGSVIKVRFLDLQNAFDTVNPHILLWTLGNIGLRHTLLCTVWCRSCLMWSTIGPLLFMYNNSLRSALLDSIHTFLYADDTALLTPGNNMEKVFPMLTVALVNAKTWFRNILLSRSNDNHLLSLSNYNL